MRLWKTNVMVNLYHSFHRAIKIAPATQNNRRKPKRTFCEKKKSMQKASSMSRKSIFIPSWGWLQCWVKLNCDFSWQALFCSEIEIFIAIPKIRLVDFIIWKMCKVNGHVKSAFHIQCLSGPKIHIPNISCSCSHLSHEPRCKSSWGSCVPLRATMQRSCLSWIPRVAVLVRQLWISACPQLFRPPHCQTWNHRTSSLRRVQKNSSKSHASHDMTQHIEWNHMAWHCPPTSPHKQAHPLIRTKLPQRLDHRTSCKPSPNTYHWTRPIADWSRHTFVDMIFLWIINV